MCHLHGTSTGDLFVKVTETPKSLRLQWEALNVYRQMFKRMYSCKTIAVGHIISYMVQENSQFPGTNH